MKIFISSPGNLQPERRIAFRVLNELGRQYEKIEEFDVFLSDFFPSAGIPVPIQAQLPSPQEYDLFVCIYWWKMGTPLPDHFETDSGRIEVIGPNGERNLTGTEYEYAWALEGWRKKRCPRILVYRKRGEAVFKAKEAEELRDMALMLQRVEQFEKNFKAGDNSYISARHSFDDTAEFEELFRAHARQMVKDILREKGHDSDLIERAAPPPIWDGRCPFRGLSRFEYRHAPIFFGRTRVITEMLLRLEQNYSNGLGFLAIVGGSGSGKSSVVRAGLLPELSRRASEGIGGDVVEWRGAVASLEEQTSPALIIANALIGGEQENLSMKALGRSRSGLMADAFTLADKIVDDPGFAAHEIVQHIQKLTDEARRKKASRPNSEVRFILFVDQLEQLFAKKDDQEHRAAILHFLQTLASNGGVWIVAALRSDFFGAYQEHVFFDEQHGETFQLNLSPPTHAEFESIIRFSAEAAGISFEAESSVRDLADILFEETLDADNSLSLLELILEKIYIADCLENAEGHAALAPSLTAILDQQHQRRGTILKIETYRSFGGVQGVLGAVADACEKEVTAEQLAVHDCLFWEFIQVPDEFSKPVAVSVAWNSLEADTTKKAFVENCLKHRLMTTSGQSGGVRVQLAHEMLLEAWPLLRIWQQNHRRLLAALTRVSAWSRRWEAEGQAPDLKLPEGQMLEEAKELLQKLPADLGKPIKPFVEASQRTAEKRLRNRRTLLVTLVVLCGVALLGGIVASIQARMLSHEYTQAKLKYDLADQFQLSVVTLQDGSLALRSTSATYEYLDDASWPRFISMAAGLERVAELDIQDCLSLTLMNEMGGLTGLQTLYISGCDNVESIDIGGLQKLKSFVVRRAFELREISGISQCRELENIDLTDCASLSELPDFKVFPELKSLIVIGCTSLKPIGSLSENPVLEHLDVMNSSAIGECKDLSFLGKKPRLKYLDLSYSKVESLRGICGAVGLRSLFLNYCHELRAVDNIVCLDELESIGLKGTGKVTNLLPIADCQPGLVLECDSALQSRLHDQIRVLETSGIKIAREARSDSRANERKRLPPWERDLESGRSSDSDPTQPNTPPFAPSSGL